MPKKFSVVKNRKLVKALYGVLAEFAGPKSENHLGHDSLRFDSDYGPVQYAYLYPSTIDGIAWFHSCFEDYKLAKEKLGHWKWNHYFPAENDIEYTCQGFRDLLRGIGARPIKD